MLRAFTNFFSGPAFEALRIREENAQKYIEGLISDNEKLNMQIKLMGIRIREQRKHLRQAAEKRGETECLITALSDAVDRLSGELDLANYKLSKAPVKKKAKR